MTLDTLKEGMADIIYRYKNFPEGPTCHDALHLVLAYAEENGWVLVAAGNDSVIAARVGEQQ